VTQGLRDPEISRVVNRYIGVSGGYLGLPDRFSYRTYADFYADYCDLDVSFAGHEGTTREVFISVLASLSPRDQAKVLCGVIERFPPGELGAPATRQAMHADLLRLIERLDAEQLVTGIMPQITSEVVERALTDAETSSKLRVQRVPWTECIPLSMVTCRPFAIARALSTDERTQWSPA
jgi:hypothetical protein